MILRLIKSTGTQVIILISIIGLLLWMHAFLYPPQITFLFDSHPMPSYKLMREIIPYNSSIGSIFTFAMILVQAIILVKLNTDFIFINNRTYMPAFFFILITASIPQLQRLNPAVFSGFFLILSLERMFSAYRNERISYEIFSASFFLSLGATFYPYLIFFILIIWAGLIILRPFRWREWIFSFLGFLLPWFFVFCWYYLLHNQYDKVYNDFKMAFETDFTFTGYTLLNYIFGAFVMLLILLASQFIIKEFTGKKILTRKAFLMFLWLFVNTLVVFVLVQQTSAELVFLAAIPISYLLSHYFTFMKSEFWGNTFVILLLFFVFLIQLKTW